MFKPIISLLLTVMLINLATAPAIYAGETAKSARFAEKVKAGIFKLGTGPAALVRVRLKNKTKLAGYVSAAGERNFTITDPKTGAATVVDYPQVKNAQGNNLSTGMKIAIGVGIAAAVIFIIYFVTVVYYDD
jgi:hypothetical protein